jgi:hypothetical protein
MTIPISQVMMIAFFITDVFGNYGPFVRADQDTVGLYGAAGVNGQASTNATVMAHTSSPYGSTNRLQFPFMHRP